MTATDDRINPTYYKSEAGIECIDVIEAFDLGYHRGNAFKYLTRWRKKNGVEDLKKAQWYCERHARQPKPDYYPIEPASLKKMAIETVANAFGFDGMEREIFSYMTTDYNTDRAAKYLAILIRRVEEGKEAVA